MKIRVEKDKAKITKQNADGEIEHIGDSYSIRIIWNKIFEKPRKIKVCGHEEEV